jgi:ribosomal protein L12E/L44/L45/RPP1/RPP2
LFTHAAYTKPLEAQRDPSEFTPYDEQEEEEEQEEQEEEEEEEDWPLGRLWRELVVNFCRGVY